MLYHCAGFNVANHHKKHVVWGVALVIVGDDVLPLDLVEDVRIPNDGVAIGTACVGGLKEPTAASAAGIVLAHVHFTPNDIQFLDQFVGGDAGVLHDVAEDINGHSGPGVGSVNMVNCPVERRIGIHGPAGVLNLLIDSARSSGGCAFEQHVLENVREAGSQPFTFMNASGLAPRLRRNHRGAAVFLDDNREAIGQGGHMHSSRY